MVPVQRGNLVLAHELLGVQLILRQGQRVDRAAEIVQAVLAETCFELFEIERSIQRDDQIDLFPIDEIEHVLLGLKGRGDGRIRLVDARAAVARRGVNFEVSPLRQLPDECVFAGVRAENEDRSR